MGMHASYYPIQPSILSNFITNVHTENFWPEVSEFRKVSIKCGIEFYIGTSWHVLDFIVNPPGASLRELIYAVRGHEFPAPDGSVRLEPHLPSYRDDFWQAYTYLTAAEATVIAQYLPLIDDVEFESRFAPEKMKDVYRAPVDRSEADHYYELLVDLQEFYRSVAAQEMAVLIDIG